MPITVPAPASPLSPQTLNSLKLLEQIEIAAKQFEEINKTLRTIKPGEQSNPFNDPKFEQTPLYVEMCRLYEAVDNFDDIASGLGGIV